MNQQICKVIKSHTRPQFESARFAKGETVRVEKRDEEWQAFLWCVHENGRAAWIPEEYLKIDDRVGFLKIDYDSGELAAIVGEILTVLKSVGGWCWCQNQAGNLGWIPERNVEV